MLLERLKQWARLRSGHPVYTFLDSAGGESASLTFAELERKVRGVAAALQERAAAGDRALLLYPPGLDFIVAFLGCLYAGTIAVPAYPPRPGRGASRLRAIARDTEARWLLTGGSAAAAIQAARQEAGDLPELAAAQILITDQLPASLADACQERTPAAEDIAFLQYTSGSTADPKGVIVTHGNLAHNEEMIRRAFRQNEDSVVVGWLPLYHDMGLIGNVLQPLYVGARAILMSPLTFLQRPALWLEAISRYRATTSGGPNFAYELCVRKVGAAGRAELDLASWRLAFNGAEPVRARTLDEFVAAFAPCGFRRDALYPCYGLAEATLFAAGGAAGDGPALQDFAAAPLDAHQARVDTAAPQRRLVGCGGPFMGQTLAIVDPETRRASPAGRVGEIWLSGPSVARGYWRRPEATAELFQARLAAESAAPAAGAPAYLRTGDLGFLHAGNLYVTGRRKDLIILQGRNFYPHDVELAVEGAHPALRPGCGVAVGVDTGGEERLVVLWELDRTAAPPDPETVATVAGLVRQRVGQELDAAVAQVVFLAPGSILKTSSGKLRRSACRAAWLAGSLPVVAESSAEPPAADATAAALDAHDASAMADRERLLALPPAARRTALAALLRTAAAAVMRMPEDLLPADVALTRLGLDSLAAVALQQRLQATLGLSCDFVELLDGLDLDRLTGRLLVGLTAAPPPCAPPAAAAPAAPTPPTAAAGDAARPLTDAQLSLWYLDRLAGHSGPYHLAGAAAVMSLHGERAALDVAALHRALDALGERHTILRTTFDDHDGLPRQRLLAGLRPELTLHDARGLTPAALAARVQDEAYRPFDLAAGPLLRLALFDGDAETRLLFVVHHIAADFAAVALLLRDLAALYAGQALPPPPAAAAADPAAAPVAFPSAARDEQLWAYWRDRLSPPPPALALATDRPRPPVQSWSGAAAMRDLGPDLHAALAGLARDSGATLFATLLAGFLALLHRHSGQADLVVGSPAGTRARPATPDAAGYFVNPLPLRSQLAGDPTFAAFVAHTRATVLAALAHQDLPFLRLAERLRPERDLSRSPLFDTLFVLHQGASPAESALAPWALGWPGARLPFASQVLESRPIGERFAPFDLVLRLAAGTGGLLASLQYSTALFDAATVLRMLGHLQQLLAAAATAPGRRVAELPLLSAAERHQLLAQWSGAAVAEAAPSAPAGAAPAPLCLHDLFVLQAARTPFAAALAAGAERLSYAELLARSQALAAVLRGLGAGPEERVGVCLARSTPLVVALLGTLLAGAAYVPLDPVYPPERLALMAADAALRVVITQPELAERLPAPPALTLLPLDPAGRPAGRRPAASAATGAPALPANLAYLIYTSGSTGRPKGVALQHAGAVALVRWALGRWSAGELAGVLFATSICFDLSVFELFVPLAAGGCVVVAESALALPDLAAAGEVTLVNTVPSAMAELVRQQALPAAVQTVNLAGEALPRPLVEALYALPGVRRVWNLYGPSEATTYSTAALMPRTAAGPPGIGRPIAGTLAYTLDSGLQLVPAGVPGELYLGGAGLARGYFGQPALTAQRFLPDPWSAEPGSRLYRTGDLARWSAGGDLDYLGRLDHQVKVRGFRIEPGEIEAALAAHPRIATAAVTVFGGADRQLAAHFVVAAGEPPPAAGELRAFLGATLPAHMIPAVFTALPAMPLTAHGKIDRRALTVSEDRRAAAAPFVPPRSRLEADLAAIWEQVLGVRPVGVSDNFFDLGGHSLKATQILAALRAAHGLHLSVRDLFAAPTVERLALAVLLAGTGDGADRIEPRPAGALPPLAFAQERLWFLDQLAPGGAAYNIPAAFRVHGPLSPPLLARALHAVVCRHEVLRTHFVAQDGRPVQIVAAASTAAAFVAQVDLSALPAAARAAEATARVGCEARRPFALDRGPLLRTLLLRLDAVQHILVWNLHHTVADAWSLGVLLREVAAAYAALARGAAPRLPALSIQYGDFCSWQRTRLTPSQLAPHLAYWRRQLAGISPLQLPADRPRPPVATHRGARRPLRLPPRLLAAAQGLSRDQGTTLFVTLLTAMTALVHRYSGQDDVAVGTVLANRGRTQLHDLIGLFAETQVLRARAVGAASWRTLLRQVGDAALGAQEHQELPFEKLVEELNPERSLGHNPLVQVIFSLQNAPLAAVLPGTGLTLERLEADSGTARLDLFLLLWEEGGGLAGTIEYSTDLFDADRMARFAAHYQELLAALTAPDLDRPPATAPLLGAGERHQLLVEWNDLAAAPVPARPAAIHHQIAAQAGRTPDSVAVVCGDTHLSFGELDGRAGRLERRLRDAGAGTAARFGVCLPRSPELVVALLATLKAGAAWVPLDPAYPRQRLAFLAADARLAAVLTDRRGAPRLAGLDLPLLAIDDASPPAHVAHSAIADGPADAVADRLAYLIYTSGSTGAPKGVMVGHASLGQLGAALDRLLGAARPGRLLAVSSASFDISIFELLWTLSRGWTVVVYRPLEEAGAIPDEILRHAVSHLQCTPSTAAGFVQDPATPAALAQLDLLMLVGEALTPALADRMTGALGGPLVNLYGPTEATVYTTVDTVAPGRPVTIGRPLAGTQVHVLDPWLQPTPIGVPGELCIGGSGLAWGYAGRPRITAERFVPDPFAAWRGARLYRTGDRVRRGADGRITFHGRLDHQVKVRGHRIEPGEIESVLVGHPSVGEAAVEARPDARGDLRLIAWLTPSAPAEPPDLAALGVHLARHLPEHLRPAVITVLPELPHTTSGKVDRRALPDPDPDPGAGQRRARGGAARAAGPSSGLQACLLGLWRELLPAPDLDLHDNFFDCGGNSLRAMQLRSRLRAALGVDLPLRTFFEAQTVALQAAAVAERLRGRRPGDAPLAPPLRDAAAAGPRPGGVRTAPLSFAQERLWFLDRLEPGSAVYNLPVAADLIGGLDPALLHHAVDRIVARHDALRTTLQACAPDGDGQPLQVIAPRLAIPLPQIDLQALPTPDRRLAEAARLAAAEALRPFDLAAGPLLRTALVRLAARHHRLLLTVHHSVSDGWSLALFFTELAAIYGAAGTLADLPELPLQYADFAVWQRRHMSGETLDELRGYWRRRLAGAPAVIELPYDRPRPAVQTYRGVTRGWRIAPATAAALRGVAAGASATLFMTLLAAWATLLHRLTRQRELVLGTPTANREHIELEPVIGFFANSLALRLDLGGAPAFGDLLARVRTAVVADYARQELPFEKLVEDLRPERSLSHHPVYQAVFAMDSSAREPCLQLPGLTLTPLPAGGGVAKFDLSLYVEERGAQLGGGFEINRDLFDPATAERWLASFQTLLAALAAEPRQPLSELPLLAPAERHQALFEANDTARAAPAEPFVHRLFAARAAAAPQVTAVSQGERRLAYGEVDRRANQLARRLRALGVGPEVRVAVALERSPELIVAMMAIWKAGGAYLPLDLSYPHERLAFLLADSRAAVLLTQESRIAQFPATAAIPLLIDAEWQELAGEDDASVAAALAPENLAYVIYTSGSTGRPKGVMIEHRALASYTATARAAYGIDAGDRVLQFCSISFDISIEEIVPCLAAGGELVLRTDAMIESGAGFLAACRERSLSVLSLPTAFWHEIVARLEADDLELPPALRLVVIAGERALPERLAAWRHRAPQRPRLVNTYGLTESTIISTLADLTAYRGGAREVPIGGAVADTEIYLLDRDGHPVARGAVGEIHLGGGLLARGYLHRPETTAERFLPHPFTTRPGARLYRTGDLAAIGATGELEFLGRGDHQVKIRGYRIELGEIEAALAEHPAVAAAAAAVREDRPGHKRVVAYVAPRSGQPPADVDELRTFLRRRLPDYMVPAAFVALAAMPLTPNGKLGRAALPAPERSAAETAYVAPLDTAQEAVAEIWRQALGVSRVGIHDNFFELGGHSLLLVQIQDRLVARFGRALTMVELFDHPTVAMLARRLSGAGAAAAADERPDAALRQDRVERGRAAARDGRFLTARRKLHD